MEYHQSQRSSSISNASSEMYNDVNFTGSSQQQQKSRDKETIITSVLLCWCVKYLYPGQRYRRLIDPSTDILWQLKNGWCCIYRLVACPGDSTVMAITTFVVNDIRQQRNSDNIVLFVLHADALLLATNGNDCYL
ncbi:hypothetical protein DAPPUDRAFT_241716 [Daphnia pulex]|uniref:Uncharacterized protein n=1 Tax=Daphnia pulex TaxID=6669 RepID=E9GEX2_DAPPU|nr:hypothetical protein DAPPUDRAFT_241716 [Daphnia pulex]|eukprot:EFX81911.1 hypothetical protein DAPPUDRAFT_241716 [Daphnia pulex]